MSSSIDSNAARRFSALALTVLVSLCGCGSQDNGGSTTTTNSQPGAIAFAYITSAAANPTESGTIYSYAIQTNNSISPLGQAATGVYPAAIAMTQSYVYVVNTGDGTISQYSVGSGDTLTPMYPANVPNPGMHTLGSAHASAAVDATGSFLYVANSADNTVSQFSIGLDGQLSQLTPSTVTTGVDPVSLASVRLADGGTGIYVVNSGVPGATGTVALYKEAQSGALTLSGSTVMAGTNPSAIAVNDTFSTVYVASGCNGAQCTGALSEFAIGEDGTLTNSGVVASTGNHYVAVDIAMDNSNTYVVGNTTGPDNNAGSLWQFGIASTGELTAINPPTLEIGPATIARAVLNQNLYVLTTNSGTGGHLDSYTLGLYGSSGAATLAASANLDAPSPLTVGILVLLAP
jgi:6-phosphogluconolactonase (cycloisomerase 2 family)